MTTDRFRNIVGDTLGFKMVDLYEYLSDEVKKKLESEPFVEPEWTRPINYKMTQEEADALMKDFPK